MFCHSWIWRLYVSAESSLNRCTIAKKSIDFLFASLDTASIAPMPHPHFRRPDAIFQSGIAWAPRSQSAAVKNTPLIQSNGEIGCRLASLKHANCTPRCYTTRFCRNVTSQKGRVVFWQKIMQHAPRVVPYSCNGQDTWRYFERPYLMAEFIENMSQKTDAFLLNTTCLTYRIMDALMDAKFLARINLLLNQSTLGGRESKVSTILARHHPGSQ